MRIDGSKILIHLGQAGRLDIEEPPKSTRSKLGVVRLLFSDRIALLVREFGTQRKAGWWVLAPGDDGPLTKLGPEPWSEELDEEIRSTTDGRRLNTFLRDQRTIAGIGRGYADEIAHHARLSPFATVGKLSSEQREGLLAAIRESLEMGLSKERKRSGGLPDKLDGRFATHGHHGHPCPRCNSLLQRVSYESHEIVYCPECQTGGRVLADRRMSRIVR
jgi:formamidopyrimidine-DNA glycosylase